MSKIRKKLSSTLAPLFIIILNCKIILFFSNEHKQGTTIFGIIKTFLLKIMETNYNTQRYGRIIPIAGSGARCLIINYFSSVMFGSKNNY